ncbi:MAG: heme exporter protein CcmD [Gammaproteobacteria bacterium]|nr:heme exporter protein CcmD [Gammaproteobacteria bacterium]
MSSSFQSWYEFLTMGGHGVYVWSAYGALFVSFIAGVLVTRRQRKLLIKSFLNNETAA